MQAETGIVEKLAFFNNCAAKTDFGGLYILPVRQNFLISMLRDDPDRLTRSGSSFLVDCITG
jgi:hypothetical protein